MKRLIPFSLAIFLLAIMAACSWQNEEELFAGDECVPENASYSEHIQPLISNSCYSCHSTVNAPQVSGLNLEDPENLTNVAISGRLFGALNHEDGYIEMPPSGIKLDSCDLLTIKKWIDAGATID